MLTDAVTGFTTECLSCSINGLDKHSVAFVCWFFLASSSYNSALELMQACLLMQAPLHGADVRQPTAAAKPSSTAAHNWAQSRLFAAIDKYESAPARPTPPSEAAQPHVQLGADSLAAQAAKAAQAAQSIQTAVPVQGIMRQSRTSFSVKQISSGNNKRSAANMSGGAEDASQQPSPRKRVRFALPVATSNADVNSNNAAVAAGNAAVGNGAASYLQCVRVMEQSATTIQQLRGRRLVHVRRPASGVHPQQ